VLGWLDSRLQVRVSPVASALFICTCDNLELAEYMLTRCQLISAWTITFNLLGEMHWLRIRAAPRTYQPIATEYSILPICYQPTARTVELRGPSRRMQRGVLPDMALLHMKSPIKALARRQLMGNKQINVVATSCSFFRSQKRNSERDGESG
jgi:hypothetical protein